MSTPSYVLGLFGASVALVVVVELLRRRHLRGKYALLYLGLSLGATVLALFPPLLGALADVAGVQLPSNLLFFVALMVLLLVTMQLAYESGRLEEETRTLAEEVALLRLQVEQLSEARQQPGSS